MLLANDTCITATPNTTPGKKSAGANDCGRVHANYRPGTACTDGYTDRQTDICLRVNTTASRIYSSTVHNTNRFVLSINANEVRQPAQPTNGHLWRSACRLHDNFCFSFYSILVVYERCHSCLQSLLHWTSGCKQPAHSCCPECGGRESNRYLTSRAVDANGAHQAYTKSFVNKKFSYR